MNKIIIIGCPGAGKTVLATKLGQKLNIPVHHLDKYFWGENWKPMPQDEFRALQNELMKEEKWILDGNLTKSIDNRIVKADTVIFLDFPSRITLWRYFKLYFQDFGKVRHDMGGNNQATIKWKHIKFILNFPRNEIYSILKQYGEGKKIYILRSSKEVTTFLAQIGN